MLQSTAVLGLFLALQTPTTPPAPPHASAMTGAILPFHSLNNAVNEDGLDLLASMLAAQLAELGEWKVISPEELRALLRNEASRQALGGAADDALREASGALGAQEVVTGEVALAGSRLVWRASLLDQSVGELRRRAEVTGPNLQALAARADEMALMLLGRANEAEDEEAVADRLGFADPSHVHDFQGFRDDHPEMGTQEALTQYIIRHNVESTRLALVEAGTFLVGALAITAALGLGYGAFLSVLLVPLAPLSLLAACLAFTLGLGGAAALASGLGIAVFDALNLGFRRVNKAGCCRDDPAIEDANQASALRRAASFVVLTSGALPFALGLALIGMLGSAYALVAVPRAEWGVAPLPAGYTTHPLTAVTAVFSGVAYLTGILGCLLPAVVALPTGLLLLFWPSRSPVEDVEAQR
jgi:hypothetical protein